MQLPRALSDDDGVCCMGLWGGSVRDEEHRWSPPPQPPPSLSLQLHSSYLLCI